ncbi:Lysophospholipase, alpha-beta hydrolase superfamily [Variovorax sp. HW608]|uniref:alpha/beta hydrolase n=1 Tax=Variovorax sp. HW608 TaxID=1034889 RepID=UPI0008201DF0|nr:alpha/beta hydrolase [Variovorax sp. HW608]SCK60531.1 Lysophospholipase, alpha-beta hydrolase superfamily [Variovorax sp. HW608]
MLRIVKRIALVAVTAVVVLAGVRIYDIQRGPPLAPWHTHAPHELSREALRSADWAAYLAAENTAFAQVRSEVTDKLPSEARIPINRYFEGSPMYPGHFKQDWNRSYVLEPEGRPRGVAVLLHGLTDSPYSLRHVAALYRDHGFVAIGIRMPGHGTVPAGLTQVEWQDWLEATRLAVREARSRVAAPLPLHIVGYSNGGALAMKYALDALDDRSLARPDRLVLLTPMIGVTELSRFAGLLGWPAIFPPFAKAAWLGIVPEFNPFKYNSFPVNGARQSSLLTRDLQEHIVREERAGRLVQLPPILAFQSLADATVSTSAIVTGLYARLPANGSELVLFDLNRNAKFGPLLRDASDPQSSRLLPPAPRTFRTTWIANGDSETPRMVERVTEAGASAEHTRPLALEYPPDVFSLSHVSLPFPVTDALYGLQPNGQEDFGISIGALAVRGENRTLVVGFDMLSRLQSNPFYPYIAERIGEGIPAR